jgi:hypothetical protein
MAAPHVAGAATLLWGFSTSSTYLDIKDALLNGVDPIPALTGMTTTGGRLNVFKSLQLVASPLVVSTSPSGNVPPPVDHVRVTFNEPMNPDTFTPDLVAFSGPDGAIAVAGVTPVDGSNNTQFDVGFDSQAGLGDYTMVIGPGIMDNFGHSAPQYTAYFTMVSGGGAPYDGGGHLPFVTPSPLGGAGAAQRGTPISGVGSAPGLSGQLGADRFAAGFASMAQPSFAGAGTAGAESVQPPSDQNDLVFSPNQGDRRTVAISTLRGQGQPHGSDAFDPFAGPAGADNWWWV